MLTGHGRLDGMVHLSLCVLQFHHWRARTTRSPRCVEGRASHHVAGIEIRLALLAVRAYHFLFPRRAHGFEVIVGRRHGNCVGDHLEQGGQ